MLIFIKKYDNIIDPFVGTGSLLIPSSFRAVSARFTNSVPIPIRLQSGDTQACCMIPRLPSCPQRMRLMHNPRGSLG